MSFQSWFLSLPTNLKIIVAVSIGISIYGLFRFFIYKANKLARDCGLDKSKPLSRRQQLQYLLREQSG
jgi:hypothetical protein